MFNSILILATLYLFGVFLLQFSSLSRIVGTLMIYIAYIELVSIGDVLLYQRTSHIWLSFGIIIVFILIKTEHHQEKSEAHSSTCALRTYIKSLKFLRAVAHIIFSQKLITFIPWSINVEIDTEIMIITTIAVYLFVYIINLKELTHIGVLTIASFDMINNLQKTIPYVLDGNLLKQPYLIHELSMCMATIAASFYFLISPQRSADQKPIKSGNPAQPAELRKELS